uniref:GIY-YIG homing endonuclease n=1 Tax=Ophiostoma novo-ulmi subsp. novo-ulmi TaxID=170179 RepID=A0A2L1IPX9_OPHNO|nr:GIY-YIG homing endonuclease [Ophiostoma novo-ulmi subsp. novo-ulmi]
MLNIRSFSTSSSNIIVFSNADENKQDILNTVKGKSGIYMWTNQLNGKKYVGSSVDLRRRFLEYYNVKRLLNESSMPICTALLKYGYKNFSLTILEICEKDNLISREKHFFEVYSPEYNILKTPGSPDRGSGWKHSEATIEMMSIAAKKKNESSDYLTNLSLAQSNSIEIEVLDLKTNTTTKYHAIREAARVLNIDKRYIEQYLYLNQNKPVLDRYTFKLLSFKEKSIEKLQKTSINLEVTNIKTKEIKVYSSIGKAARDLGYYQASISLYLKENRTKPFKGTYIFKILNDI